MKLLKTFVGDHAETVIDDIVADFNKKIQKLEALAKTITDRNVDIDANVEELKTRKEENLKALERTYKVRDKLSEIIN